MGHVILFPRERCCEICVLCRRITRIPRTLPIHERYGYVEGVGQLCADCYGEILFSSP